MAIKKILRRLKGRSEKKYKKNYLIINGHRVDFKYDIGKVIPYKEKYIILLEIPLSKRKNEINNIYCVDSQGNLVWQSGDIVAYDPGYGYHSACLYMGMSSSGDIIYGTDFMGRCYHINPENGKIEGYHFTKWFIWKSRKLL